MAGFGYGFGTGVLRGLNRNIERDDTLRLQQAQLTGDIMGLQSELPEEERGALPTGTEPRSGLTSILGAFGLTENRLPDMERQIIQRAALAAKSKAYQRKLAEWKDTIKRIENGEFTREEEDRLLQSAPGVMKLVLPGIIRKSRSRQAMRSKIFPDTVTRIGSTGAQEEGEVATDVTTSEKSLSQKLIDAFGEKGLSAAVSAARPPAADPTSLIQPGPGTPASVVNRRTLGVTPLPGTERPSPAADPVMNEYRRLRNDYMRNRNAGNVSPKERHAQLLRLIPMADKFAKDATDPQEKALYQKELRLYLSELRKLESARRAAPAPQPAPAQPGGGGGLPQGWRFAD